MNALEMFAGLDWWAVAGWTMLHYLWLGLVVGAVAAVLRFALRRASANARYAAALASLVALTVLPVGVGVWVAGVGSQEPGARKTGGDRIVDAGASPQAVVGAERGEARVEGVGAVSSAKPQAVEEAVELVRAPEMARRVASVLVDAAPIAVRPLADWSAAVDIAARWLPWVWIVGAPVTFLLLATGVVGAERLRRESRLVVDGPVVECLERLRTSLAIGRHVAVAVCERVAAPVLVGIVRPLVLLPPAALTGWSPEEIEMVLLHELAHVRRWDNLVNLLQRLVEAVLFFQPAVWLVSGWVRREREACCDAVVVGETQMPQAYAELLVALAAQLPRSVLFHPAAASAMAAGPLRGRIRRILGIQDDPMLVSGQSLGIVMSTLLLAATLVVLNLPTLGTAKEPAAEDSRTSVSAADSLEKYRQVVVGYDLDFDSVFPDRPWTTFEAKRLLRYPTPQAWPDVLGHIDPDANEFREIRQRPDGNFAEVTGGNAFFVPLDWSVGTTGYTTLLFVQGIEADAHVVAHSYTSFANFGTMAGDVLFKSYATALVDGDLSGQITADSYFNLVVTGKFTGRINTGSYAMVYLMSGLAGEMELKHSKVYIAGRTDEKALERIRGVGKVFLEESDLAAGEHQIGELAVTVKSGTTAGTENKIDVAKQGAATQNNLKDLMLAILNYEAATHHFPTRARFDASGKPLLSWRVLILPYLPQAYLNPDSDEAKLCKEFHFDEPWDSEHNRKLIARMPEVFKNPRIDRPGFTNYLAVVGEECMFRGDDQAVQLKHVSDGISRTIAVVEADADRAVEWTKPADWEFERERPTAGLGGLWPTGWYAAFVDGRVTHVSNRESPEEVGIQFTRGGGETKSLAESAGSMGDEGVAGMDDGNRDSAPGEMSEGPGVASMAGEELGGAMGRGGELALDVLKSEFPTLVGEKTDLTTEDTESTEGKAEKADLFDVGLPDTVPLFAVSADNPEETRRYPIAEERRDTISATLEGMKKSPVAAFQPFEFTLESDQSAVEIRAAMLAHEKYFQGFINAFNRGLIGPLRTVGTTETPVGLAKKGTKNSRSGSRADSDEGWLRDPNFVYPRDKEVARKAQRMLGLKLAPAAMNELSDVYDVGYRAALKELTVRIESIKDKPTFLVAIDQEPVGGFDTLDELLAKIHAEKKREVIASLMIGGAVLQKVLKVSAVPGGEKTVRNTIRATRPRVFDAPMTPQAFAQEMAGVTAESAEAETEETSEGKSPTAGLEESLEKKISFCVALFNAPGRGGELRELSKKFMDEGRTLYLYGYNVDPNSPAGKRFGLTGAPTCIVFQHGQETGRLDMIQTREQLVQFVEAESPKQTAADGTIAKSKFPTLEEQKLADLAYRRLGLELEKIGAEDLKRVEALGYDGGVKVTNDPPGMSRAGMFQEGDILVGLAVWPTRSLNEVAEVLNRDDLAELSPLKFYVVRPDGDPDSIKGPLPDKVVTDRISVELEQPERSRRTAANRNSEAPARTIRPREQAFDSAETLTSSEWHKSPIRGMQSEQAMRDRPIFLLFAYHSEDYGRMKHFSEVLHELKRAHAGRIDSAIINLTHDPNLSKSFKIDTLPICIVYYHGNEFRRYVGEITKEQLQSAIADINSKKTSEAPQPASGLLVSPVGATRIEGGVPVPVPHLQAAPPPLTRNDKENLRKAGPIRIDVFYAPDDGPSSQALGLIPVYQKEFPGLIEVKRIDVTQDPRTASKAGLGDVLPAYKLYQGDIEIQTNLGLMRVHELEQALVRIARQGTPTRVAPAKTALRYDGKSFHQWRTEWQTELSTAKRIEAVKALAAFGRAGYGKEAAAVILDVAGEYDFTFMQNDNDANGKLKQAVVEVLSPESGRPSLAEFWLPDLVARAKDDAGKWRPLLVYAVGQLRSDNPQVIGLLRTLAEEGPAEVRGSALGALMRSERISDRTGKLSEETRKLLAAALTSDDLDQRRSALWLLVYDPNNPWALGWNGMGDARLFYLPEIMGPLLGADEELRQRARLQLQYVQAKDAPALLGQLLKVLKDESRAAEHVEAIRAIAAMGPAGAAATEELKKVVLEGKDDDEIVAAMFASKAINDKNLAPNLVQGNVNTARLADEILNSKVRTLSLDQEQADELSKKLSGINRLSPRLEEEAEVLYPESRPRSGGGMF